MLLNSEKGEVDQVSQSHLICFLTIVTLADSLWSTMPHSRSNSQNRAEREAAIPGNDLQVEMHLQPPHEGLKDLYFALVCMTARTSPSALTGMNAGVLCMDFLSIHTLPSSQW